MRGIFKKLKAASIGWFLVELVLYAGCVLAYYFLVLHYVAPRIKEVYDANRVHYAIYALLLMLTQGVCLELLTSALLRLIRRKAR